MIEFVKEHYTTGNENIKCFTQKIFEIVKQLYQEIAPDEVKKRKNINRMLMSDVEIITMTVVGELSGVDSERAWYEYCRKNMGDIFPRFCERSRFNRIKRNLHAVVRAMFDEIVKVLSAGDIQIVDSAPLPVCHFGRAHFHKTYKCLGADYGCCASKKEIYYGYKLHALCSLTGYPTGYLLTPASTDDRKAVDELAQTSQAQALIGDKGYIGAHFANMLLMTRGVRMLVLPRKNMTNPCFPPRFRNMIFKLRRRIETLFSQLSDQLNVQRVRAKSLSGLITRLNFKFLAFLCAVLLNTILGNPHVARIKHFIY